MAKSNSLNFKVTIGTSTCKFNKYLLFLLTCTCMVKSQVVKNTFMENGMNHKYVCFLYYMPQYHYVLFCKYIYMFDPFNDNKIHVCLN